MRYVNDILDGKRLDEFTSTATKDQLIELRTSASIGIGIEKRARDSGQDTHERRKYIAFLSAAIQESDKALAALKKTSRDARKDFALLFNEYELFRKLTKSIAGNDIYSEIINKLENELK
jgi:hypothetical protein